MMLPPIMLSMVSSGAGGGGHDDAEPAGRAGHLRADHERGGPHTGLPRQGPLTDLLTTG